MTRDQLFETLSNRILSLRKPYPVRIAIDGVDGSGKTTLADELLEYLANKTDRQIIRASIDGFHNPREIRYKNGKTAKSYYEDSFDNAALKTALLNPLEKDGSLLYRPAAFDYRTDTAVHLPLQKSTPNAILIIDGVFLLRPDLRDNWDLSIFIDVPFQITLERAIVRDATRNQEHDAEDIKQQYQNRYIPGQELYFANANPKSHADIVLDSSNFSKPRFLKI